jgi:hypothetical protein
MTDIARSCRPNAINKFALSTFSVQLRALTDIKKGDQIFISYLTLPMPTPKRQLELAKYDFQCTCTSCTTPGSDDLRQKILERVMELSKSFDKWISDRSLPNDHLIKPALKLVPLIEKNGLSCSNICEINFVTLMKCYAALGDLPNTTKYATRCGLWHLVREGNSELYEGMKRPQTHMMGPAWRKRV